MAATVTSQETYHPETPLEFYKKSSDSRGPMFLRDDFARYRLFDPYTEAPEFNGRIGFDDAVCFKGDLEG